MGLLRFQVFEMFEFSNRPDVYRLREVHLADNTNCIAIAELCAKMSRLESDRHHYVKWVMVPWFDAAADLTAADTHTAGYLPPVAPAPPVVTVDEVPTSQLPPRPPDPPAIAAPDTTHLTPTELDRIQRIRRIRRPHRGDAGDKYE